MLKNFLFVGNSQGIIRVFDLKTQKEMKPLMDKQYVGHEKVTTMDISGENGLLLAGYSDGSIVLWDLIDYKLLKQLPNLHETNITNIKIYRVSANGNQI